MNGSITWGEFLQTLFRAREEEGTETCMTDPAVIYTADGDTLPIDLVTMEFKELASAPRVVAMFREEMGDDPPQNEDDDEYGK